jgi:hypothetical protein
MPEGGRAEKWDGAVEENGAIIFGDSSIKKGYLSAREKFSKIKKVKDPAGTASERR